MREKPSKYLWILVLALSPLVHTRASDAAPKGFLPKQIWAEKDGVVVIEAEDLDHHAHWAERTTPKGFSGRAYLEWTGPRAPGKGDDDFTGERQHAQETHLILRVLVSNPGVYRLDVRNFHRKMDGDNDAWVSELGRAAEEGWPIKRLGDSLRDGDGFTWLDWGRRPFVLERGINTLYIGGRSPGFAVDRVVLYREADALAERTAHDLATAVSAQVKDGARAAQTRAVLVPAKELRGSNLTRFGKDGSILSMPATVPAGTIRSVPVRFSGAAGRYVPQLVYLATPKGRPRYELIAGDRVIFAVTGATPKTPQLEVVSGEPITLRRGEVVTLRLTAAEGAPARVRAVAFSPEAERPATVQLSRAEYEDKAQAVWIAQIASVLMGLPFEHKAAAVRHVDKYPRQLDAAPIDDDWYYELVLLRALEKHGPGVTVEQLGAHWLAHNTGTWGSSEQARLLLARGVKPPDTGHPRQNRLWFTMGNQCRGDLFGLLAPGRPNLAARLARGLGHINSYAEGTDGGVLVAGMISIAFCEQDPRRVVRQAARLLAPETPHRRMLDEALQMADEGRGFKEIVTHIEDRWHIEYPATNNSVANAGIAAMAVYFGEGDFLKSVNLAFGAADFTDADCNAAVAGAVVAAMHGMKALPRQLVEPLRDRMIGDKLGPVALTPPVNESISGLAKRTVAAGEAMLRQHGTEMKGDQLVLRLEEPEPQPAERFHPNDFGKLWDSDWVLERAGFGAPGGGVRNLRGGTFLDKDMLVTYPRDEVRGVQLRRHLKVGDRTQLRLEVGADPGRAWQLAVHVDNDKVLTEVIDGGAPLVWQDLPPLSQPETDYVLSTRKRTWRKLTVDLAPYKGKEVTIRLFQTVLVRDKVPGNAYWKRVVVDGGEVRAAAK